MFVILILFSCFLFDPLRTVLIHWTLGGVPVFFAERPTEWIGVSNPSAGKQILHLRVHVLVSTIMQYLCIVHVYMFTCKYARMHYAAIHVTCVLVSMRL